MFSQVCLPPLICAYSLHSLLPAAEAVTTKVSQSCWGANKPQKNAKKKAKDESTTEDKISEKRKEAVVAAAIGTFCAQIINDNIRYALPSSSLTKPACALAWYASIYGVSKGMLKSTLTPSELAAASVTSLAPIVFGMMASDSEMKGRILLQGGCLALCQAITFPGVELTHGKSMESAFQAGKITKVAAIAFLGHASGMALRSLFEPKIGTVSFLDGLSLPEAAISVLTAGLLIKATPKKFGITIKSYAHSTANIMVAACLPMIAKSVLSREI